MQFIKATVLVCFMTLFMKTEEKCMDDNVCIQTKTHGLWSADCYNANFKNFPRCLRSDVEVIDLSYNRLRKVTKEDVTRYTSLKMLYLSDNLLTNLDDSTFESMDKLFSLDLSINGITKLPPVIFHLPSLKRLYLSQNQNINVVEAVEEAKPIASPLETLDVSFNEMETLPKLGIMPFLKLYNISGNNLVNIEVKDLAGLCHLQKLATDNFTAFFENPCDCWNIQRWLTQRDVKFTIIECQLEENECVYNISDENMALYNECKALYSEIGLKSTLLKVGIGVTVLVLLLLTILACFIYRRRKQRRILLKKIEAKNGSANGNKESEGLL